MFLLELTLICRFGKRSPLLQRSVHPRAIASSASIVQLKEKIRVAIDEEDYEAAATYRDELRFEFHPSYGIENKYWSGPLDLTIQTSQPAALL